MLTVNLHNEKIDQAATVAHLYARWRKFWEAHPDFKVTRDCIAEEMAEANADGDRAKFESWQKTFEDWFRIVSKLPDFPPNQPIYILEKAHLPTVGKGPGE